LTFLFDAPASMSVRIGDHLVAEGADDIATLREFGTDRVSAGDMFITMSGGSVTGRIGSNELSAILPQQAGVRIYQDALRAPTKSAQLREYWKVLESAFGCQGEDLVALVATYRPALELGWTSVDLRSALILRGRASHGQSRAGITELAHVERLSGEWCRRLKSLAGRVIETKASWGLPTLAWHERLTAGRRVPIVETT
jgi:hypothetical protein